MNPMKRAFKINWWELDFLWEKCVKSCRDKLCFSTQNDNKLMLCEL